MPRPPRRRLRVCLLDPTHPGTGRRHPLLDDDFPLRVVDAGRLGLRPRQVVAAVLAEPVDVVMLGHPGSPCAEPGILNLVLRLKRLHPGLVVVCCGVHATDPGHASLARCRAIDFVLRGADEGMARDLLRRLDGGEGWPFRSPGARGAGGVRL